MKYNNIYEYLDAVFGTNINPSKEDVISAKKQYYKFWHKEYNRKRRKQRKEFTLGFDSKTLQRIKQEKGTRTVSKYLYDAVFNTLDGGHKSDFDNEQLVVIHQKLMQLIALLEEGAASPQIEQLLERIEELELQFSKLTA